MSDLVTPQKISKEKTKDTIAGIVLGIPFLLYGVNTFIGIKWIEDIGDSHPLYAVAVVYIHLHNFVWDLIASLF